MNVIVANRYQSLLQGLNIDIIKQMVGEFEVDDIISTFQNFFYQRMILDITAIKNYKDVKTLQKLSISLDMDKVILLLDDSPESTSPDYISKLVSMGIYNFTKNAEGIMYLYNNPNSYRDVAQYQQLDVVTPIVQGQDGASVNQTGLMQPEHGRIIGVKNVTDDSGATTLIYMMKKQLEKNYSVVAIEVDKRDFMFFREKGLVSTNTQGIGNEVSKYSNKDVILIDINRSASAESLCTEVFYLIEPSIIKLNKLMMTDGKVLQKLKGKKVILNQSLLSSKDVLDFEYESKIKIFYNMPPLNEREANIQVLNSFLTKAGFTRQAGGEQEKKSKLLGIFNI
ncbi:MAG TPA: hypothetical protein IAD49_00570 [Candidatus Fimihabitans intestinipullorum]|uniref:Uncharacterized protein n=1 Tax=Candidatus Fimihabitans intestinipullorum TaxID=2840820 RepID=A0A9D1HVM5_9BACT|nr:hypothetical protein [Candidatus Fimihabitans intestinipullorum]